MNTSLIKDILKFYKERKEDKNTYANKMGSYTVIVWFDLICLVHLLDQQRNVQLESRRLNCRAQNRKVE